MATTQPPTFDGPAFARWLRRWKEAEGMEWGHIANRSGLAIGTVMALARGVPQKSGRDRGQTAVNPAINTFTRLAAGLGMDLAYVLGKGGLVVGDAARWDHFSNSERELLLGALINLLTDPDVPASDRATHDRLLHELQATLTQEVTA